AESRTLARRLCSLPQLTDALESGAIGWSMAELLARHATPQTEAALLQIARGKTVAAMRIALSSQESPGSPGSSRSTESPASPPQLDDDDDLTRTLSLTLPVEEAWALEATRMMVEHMDGKSTGAHFLESLLAEATISLLELIPASENNFSTKAEAEHAAWCAEMQRLQHLQAQAELQSRPAVGTDPTPGEAPAADDLPAGGQSVEALDTRIRHYSAELASRDLFFGRIARRFLTLRGWLTRATRRTFKHLREEVQAVEMATRFLNETDHSPPSNQQLEQMQALERAILSGELLRKITRDRQSEHDEPNGRAGTDEACAPAPDPAVQISVGPSAKITLRIRVPGDLLLHFRQLERLHRKHFPDESFIQFLCTTFWQTWVPELGTSDKWEQIYRRDRYRCTNPVCHQRNVTLHHVHYRANGGTDDAENLTSPCAFCHLEGEHGGRLKILPPGKNPTWLLGRHPIIKVHRRERTLLN
ncbi:MAG: HNH endonuclease, partial [Polyangiales bacterium]